MFVCNTSIQQAVYLLFSIGLLKHKEGYILKSVEGGTKGKNEVRFYEELRKNESLINLRKLVPLYYGTVTLEINSLGR